MDSTCLPWGTRGSPLLNAHGLVRIVGSLPALVLMANIWWCLGGTWTSSITHPCLALRACP